MGLSRLEMLSRLIPTDFDDGLDGYWNLWQTEEPGVFEINTEVHVPGGHDLPVLAIDQRWRVTVEEITG